MPVQVSTYDEYVLALIDCYEYEYTVIHYVGLFVRGLVQALVSNGGRRELLLFDDKNIRNRLLVSDKKQQLYVYVLGLPILQGQRVVVFVVVASASDAQRASPSFAALSQ